MGGTLAFRYRKVKAADIVSSLNSDKEYDELVIVDAEIEGEIEGLKPNLSLKKLLVQTSNMTSKSLLNILRSATNIESMGIINCQFITEIPTLAFELSFLKSFGARGSNITTGSLFNLLRCALNLEHLYIAATKYITDIPSLSYMLNRLKTLVADESNLTSKGLVSLLQSSPNIIELSIRDCKFITNIDGLTVELEQLEELDASYSNLTNQGLKEILEKCKNLQKLSLIGCKNITDIEDLKITLPTLTDIDAQSSNITAKGLVQLLHCARNVKTLELHSTKINGITGLTYDLIALKSIGFLYSHLSTEDANAILDRAPNVLSLDIYGCLLIEPELLKIPTNPKFELGTEAPMVAQAATQDEDDELPVVASAKPKLRG